MNILITLPKHLIEKIISGEKKYEMRKCLPKQMKIGEDGFFVVEKGTDNVIMWCRVVQVIEVTMNALAAVQYAGILGVTPQFIQNYAPVGTKVYLWEIGDKKIFCGLKRGSLLVDKNPQQFAYCPQSLWNRIKEKKIK